MTTPSDDPGSSPTPATVAAPGRLDRVPGERYRGSSTTAPPSGHASSVPWSRRRRVGLAVVVALAGGAVVLLLGGLDVGPGLLAIGAATGWLTGLAMAGGASPGRGSDAGASRGLASAGIAGGGIALGLVADGVRALAEGGVLNPVAYVVERYGPLAAVVIAAAAIAGLLRGR